MDTKELRNLWSHSNAVDLDAGALAQDLQVDLTIIGGGFTGCSAALAAAKAGASVCLLEAETVAHGGSGRNVGLVNAGLWTPPRDIEKLLGKIAADRLNALLAAAPARVFSLIKEHGIPCEPVHNGTLHCAHSARGMADLKNRCEQQLSIGAPVSLLSAEEARARTGSVKVHGALFDPRAGTIQPLAYAKGLARAAQSLGARICKNTPANSATFESGVWHVQTDRGTVRSKSLLQATNAYLSGDLKLARQDFVPVGYSQIATAPLPPELLESILPNEEGCWDTALVMTSFRRDAAGRLIVGGMGSLEHPAGGIHANWARRKLVSLFPKAAQVPIEHLWNGRIAMTSDHLPKIVQVGPNALSCFGYSGRGIGPGTVFGEASAQALLTGSTEELPVAPVPDHQETFCGIRQTYFETGATLIHLLAARGN